MNEYYCAFHILTGEYVFCHEANQKFAGQRASFLLPLGATYDYDSPAVMLRYTSREHLYNRLMMELSNPGLYYKDHCIEEFEIHEFNEKLVPPHHKWKEYYTYSGRIKENWER